MADLDTVHTRMKLVKEALDIALGHSICFEQKDWNELVLGDLEDVTAMVDKLKLLKAEIDRRDSAAVLPDKPCVQLPNLKDFGL